MSIQRIHSYLVRANRTTSVSARLRGTSVPLQGKLFDLLKNIYDSASDECDLEIKFKADASGSQQNPCRNLIVEYLAQPTIPNGRRIATRLGEMTDNRSGLGLLFLISGMEGRNHRILISRFPTDSAILADEDATSLSISFLERVFLKNRNSYKAVLYHDSSLTGGFWVGRAIDRQINLQTTQNPNYWISDFLLSEFAVTPAAGTRRMANALREAARKSPVEVKREIIAAATLATGLAGQRISVSDFCSRFGLSSAADGAIKAELKVPRVEYEQFRFDREEFEHVIAFRSIELDNGGMMTAPSTKFDEIFRQETVRGKDQEVRFSTQGKIVDEKIRKTR